MFKMYFNNDDEKDKITDEKYVTPLLEIKLETNFYNL